MCAASERFVPELPCGVAAVCLSNRGGSGRIGRVRPRRHRSASRPQPQVPAVAGRGPNAGACDGTAGAPVRRVPRATAAGGWPQSGVRDRSRCVPRQRVGTAHRFAGSKSRGRTAVVASPCRAPASGSHRRFVPLSQRPGQPPHSDRRRTHLWANRSKCCESDRSSRYLHPDRHLSRYYVKQEHNRSRTQGGGVAQKRLTITDRSHAAQGDAAPNPTSDQTPCCAVFDIAHERRNG